MMTDDERLKIAQEEVMMIIHENPSLSFAEIALLSYLRGCKDASIEFFSAISCEVAIQKAKKNGVQS